MYRRWQKDATNKYQTLQSFNHFMANLTALDETHALKLCGAADVYSVLSVLHSKGRNPQLQVNKCPGFYYFLANAVQTDLQDENASGGGAVNSIGCEGAGACADRNHVRLEAVVPISSKNTNFTMSLLSKFFELDAHPTVSHILLAVVDDDGSVSLTRVFNFLQPPFDGPETLPPLEAEGGNLDVNSDDG